MKRKGSLEGDILEKALAAATGKSLVMVTYSL
jgi:hypothetical protein